MMGYCRPSPAVILAIGLLAVTLLPGDRRTAAAPPPRPYPRAMWLWDPEPQLLDAAERTAFLAFCRREGIGRVWMQISTSVGALSSTGPATDTPVAGARPKRVLEHQAEWRSLLAEAHAAGLKIDALDGDPRYALRQLHYLPFAIVDAVIEFNKSARPNERFDGIHFDNEPYLLRAWRTQRSRELLLGEFMELNVECLRRVRAQPGMEYGIDIPFWWQYTNSRTGVPHGDVAFEGTRKAASFHCIDRLDNIGVMDYRNVADGSDGLVAHASELLAYADRAGHASVYVGVDTSESSPTDYWFAVGLPSDLLDQLLGTAGEPGEAPSRIAGFRVRLFDDGMNTHVGIQIPSGDEAAQQAAMTAAMVQIAKQWGAATRPGTASRVDDMRATAFRALADEGDWRDVKSRSIVDAASGREYGGFQATRVGLAKLTFAGKPPETMSDELERAEREFRKYRSYAGIAIHHYESYRKMLRGSPASERLQPR
jgi:hypothetical protein